MRNVVMLMVCLLSWAALADNPAKKQLTQAADAIEDAYERANRSSRRCQAAIAQALDSAVDRVDDLRRNATDQQIFAMKSEIAGYAASAPLAGCPVLVVEDLQRCIEYLEDARQVLWRADSKNDRNSRRDRRKNDQNAYVAPSSTFVMMAPLQVATNVSFEKEPAVRISVPEMTLNNMQGQVFYIGARYRSYEGEWSEWTTTQTWTVPNQNFVWKNAFNHFFRYSALAEDDFSDGRFVAHIAIFSGNGQPLTFREQMFKVNLPKLPNAPPPPPGGNTVPAGRNCGTGSDLGCLMTRDGQYAMDGAVFAGIVQSLRAQPNEVLRVNSAQALLARQYMTATQLGVVMDLFGNELYRLKVVEENASHVVNPQHAAALSTKFTNSFFAQRYTQVMAAQPPGVMPGQQPAAPPMVQPPARPQTLLAAQNHGTRDCGTGQDPGCTSTRANQLPMDATTFTGFIQSLRATNNELVRADMCKSVLNRNYMTALQFGVVLDQFSNELTRLDIARDAADHVVNPQHALGFATKFRNSINAREYTEVITAQR